MCKGMPMKKLIICLILHLVNNLEAVNVTVYYEALCSDSVNFITRQLYPNYHHFKKHLTINFVPYGKALHTFNATTGNYTFNCQHGNEECKGNKFQACALSQVGDQETQLNFITCVMSSRDPSNIYFTEECAKKYNLNFTQLVNCAISKEGDKLLAFYGDQTWNLEPNLYYVPTVVFNNSTEINEVDQRKSLDNFKEIVCTKIMKKRPEVCDELSLFQKIKNFFS